MVFVGVDMAWQADRNPSGVAVLEGDTSGARLRALFVSVRPLADVLRVVEEAATGPAVVAVDAPLVIPNLKGARRCERELGRLYAARHAACHPSNLTLYPDAAGVRLASHLSESGFRHGAPLPEPQHGGRVMMEVYTHAALVALLSLPRIIRYKKGTVAERAQGLRELQRSIAALAMVEASLIRTPLLDDVLAADPALLRGSRRKGLEDSLDAVVCAYTGYHAWRWGDARSEVFGNVAEGYIVNPKNEPESNGADR